MTISIIGATGHLGHALARRINDLKIPLRIVCRNTSNVEYFEKIGLDVARADLENVESLTEAISGSEYVIHLASKISVMPLMRKALTRTNVQGTRNVIQACMKTGVEKLIYASSIQAISPGSGDKQINENSEIDPYLTHDDYGFSKAKATIDVLQAAHTGKLRTTVLCPTGIIGPHDPGSSQIGKFLKVHMKFGTYAFVSGAYDFVDVRDVSNAIIDSTTMGADGQHYLLSGSKVSVKNFLKYICELTDKRMPIIRIPNSLALIAGHTNGYINRFIGRETWFTASSLRTIWSNSEISSSLAKKDLNFQSRPWQSSIRDQLNDLTKRSSNQRF
tara:strand:+ start:355 stop:1350 length:996 start_codon:yes stop_codon:yes gene_type:complete